MAIIHMIEPTDPRAYCVETTSNGHSYGLMRTHEGFCVSEREANGYNDSDFYMTVWLPDEQRAEEICFASTRGWTYPCLGSKVDAGEGVMVAYRRWLARKAQHGAFVAAAATMKKPHVGAVVRVTGGRLAPKGFEGRVISIKEECAHTSRYGTWSQYRTIAQVAGPNASWRVNADFLDVLAPASAQVQRVFDLAEVA